MSTRVVVIGASGFGRETLDTIVAVNAASPAAPLEVVGVVDDAPSPENLARLERRGVPWLGGLGEWLAALGEEAEASWPSYVVGIGSPVVRSRVVAALSERGLRAASVVHPRAIIGTNVRLGEGAVICAGAILSTEVVLGRHCHINPGAVIGHDTELGDFVSVNPNATVSGDCVIREQTLIGAGAVVLQGLAVGARVTVGAASCVTRKVPDGVVVKGVPGRW